MNLIEALATHPPLLYGCTLFLGLVVGSFLNVVIYRLPKIMEHQWHSECAQLLEQEAPQSAPASIAVSASRCPHCGHRIRPWENIPILSWVLLRARCSSCSGSISIRYPLIEALSAALSLLVVLQFGFTPEALAALVFTWSLIALGMIDFDTHLLPDSITMPLLWLGLLLSLTGMFTDPQSSIIGAAVGWLSLWGVYQLFRILTGKEGMGHGDFKLLAMFGAWMGWQNLLQILLLSTLPGAIIGTALIIAKRHEGQVPMAFGPYLAIAGWIALMWGEAINSAYLGLTGLR